MGVWTLYLMVCTSSLKRSVRITRRAMAHVLVRMQMVAGFGDVDRPRRRLGVSLVAGAGVGVGA